MTLDTPELEAAEETLEKFALGKYGKAIAALLYIVGVNLLFFITGDETFADVTVREWVFVGTEALGAFGIVYAVPNKT
jgi:hypothetical protein